MATTAGGLPYVEPSDLVSGWPAVSQDLAEELDTQLAAKAPLASPTFTGTPALPSATTVASFSAFTTWTAWTPTISGTGWAVGNATVAGRYTKVGKIVHAWALVIWGSTSTFGTGGLAFSLPVTSVNHLTSAIVDCYDASLGKAYILQTIQNSTSSVLLHSVQSSIGLLEEVIQGKPFTWASGDFIRFYYTYEAA